MVTHGSALEGERRSVAPRTILDWLSEVDWDGNPPGDHRQDESPRRRAQQLPNPGFPPLPLRPQAPLRRRPAPQLLRRAGSLPPVLRFPPRPHLPAAASREVGEGTPPAPRQGSHQRGAAEGARPQ
ncbi:unnamed protein product [Musa acuminata subsp. malaccensis]|uniref:(wild Malaysian banana) hypothetical protein n=1 Tax=Musa acuminata subsp. malaccensis TaxID=214687 RepID=A0A804IT91_MUSAM|nr:unnamed protein product [Musa acuminata subsp. malaccensis]